MVNKNMVDKDELMLAAVAVDSMGYIIQLMLEDYFDKYIPSDENNKFAILYDFARNRAYANILLALINTTSKVFKQNDISAYSE